MRRTGREAPRRSGGSTPRPRYVRRFRGLALPVAVLPALALDHGPGLHAPVVGTEELCLLQVQEINLPSFAPVGLSTFEDPEAGPIVTMWSRAEVLAMRVSAAESDVGDMVRMPLPGITPLAAAVADWNEGKPVVELFDAAEERVWAWEPAEGSWERTAAPGVVSASGALREGASWVRAHKMLDASADTFAIVLRGSGFDTSAEPPTAPDSAPPREETRRRGIDRILHVRPGGDGGAVVGEAAFPFSTVGFAGHGAELWRAAPEPDELRGVLGEPDLRYVIATPSVAVDDAVLNTFVALRTGRRVSALRQIGDPSPRYREIPGDLAFLGAFERHALLVATRSGQPNRLALFRWRWIDQGQRCTHPSAQGRL